MGRAAAAAAVAGEGRGRAARRPGCGKGSGNSGHAGNAAAGPCRAAGRRGPCMPGGDGNAVGGGPGVALRGVAALGASLAGRAVVAGAHLVPQLEGRRTVSRRWAGSGCSAADRSSVLPGTKEWACPLDAFVGELHTRYNVKYCRDLSGLLLVGVGGLDGGACSAPTPAAAAAAAPAGAWRVARCCGR